MAVTIYKVYNGPMPTTAAFAKLATGTAIKTHIQLAPPSGKDVPIVGWGISFDAAASNTSIECEVIETDVAATVTAHTSTGLHSVNNPGGSASQVQVGTALTGYNASAEGTITAVRLGDVQLIQPTNQYVYDFLLGYEFTIRSGKFGRLRVTASATVNAVAYLAYAE
ncbi:MAG: hypothetical protein ACRDQU_00800 [Pseudonocardiaceae bacterium]